METNPSNRTKETIISFIAGGLNTLLVVVQSMVLMPMCLKYIGSNLYGAWLAIGDILVWLQALDLGIPNIITQKIAAAQGKDKKDYRYSIIVISVLILLIVSIAVCLLGGLIAPHLFLKLSTNKSESFKIQWCFKIGVLAAAVNLFCNCFIGVARGLQKTSLISLFSIVATIAGIITSFYIIKNGGGVWGLPIAMLVRSVVMLIGSIAFWYKYINNSDLKGCVSFNQVLADLAELVPMSSISGVAYSLIQQSESLIAAYLVSPKAAVTLAVTRKASEVIRALLDIITFSAYGPFSNLVASGSKDHAWAIFNQITTIRMAISIAAVSAYITVNKEFVGLWVGQEMFGGHLLSVVIGMHVVLSCSSFFNNYLYRACGSFTHGSIGLVIESAARGGLIALLQIKFGIFGMIIAGCITSIVAMFIYLKLIRENLCSTAKENGVNRPSLYSLMFLPAATALAICLPRLNWMTVVIIAGGVFFLSLTLQMCLDGELRAAVLNRLAFFKHKIVAKQL